LHTCRTPIRFTPYNLYGLSVADRDGSAVPDCEPVGRQIGYSVGVAALLQFSASPAASSLTVEGLLVRCLRQKGNADTRFPD
jgi:hypothetical protein